MQTGQIPKAPIILMGEKAHWDEILDLKTFERLGLLSTQAADLFRYAEGAIEAWWLLQDALRAAPGAEEVGV